MANIDKEMGLISAELMEPLINELMELIPDNLKEAHKDAILYGRSCFIVDKDGITPIGQGEINRGLNEETT